ncbi:MCE family protein [Actinomadura rugatobispora]|uniref:MCE family protein n=1 Tax=Actinomadura rugatobispora TaxID=1994 RepID=A0ABW0ZZ67_9ACTN|nr:hypothetical protein GCM10010200_014490 [Actinomadura rugatobispora]
MSDAALSARSRALYAALGAGALAAAVTTAAVAALPGDSGATRYTAAFGRAGQGLDARSDVKVRGVTVGTVESVGLEPDGRVRVRLRVERGVRIPRDARARIDPVSIFGPKEISLDLGPAAGRGPYLADGGTITRTQDPADPADTARPLYDTARAIDPQDMATIVHTLAQGTAGQGPALRRTIGNGSRVIDAAHADRAVINGLINDLGGLGGTLQNRGGALVGTARDAGALSASLGDRPDKVTRLLDQAAQVSSRVGDDLQGHGDDLGRIVDGAGRTANVAAARSGELLMLVDALNGFFDGLASVMTAAGPEGTRPAVLKGTLPLDACAIVADLCGPAGSGVPSSPAGRRR